MKTLAPFEFIWFYRGPTPPGCMQRGLSISIIYGHTSIYVFFCDINWFFGFHANGRNSRILRSWEPWWIYVILLFGGHEIATPTRWGIAMITTSTDLPIYTLNLFNGTQASLISSALHVLEVQDSVAWAKGSIFKNDSIERIGQSLDTAEKSKLTLPSVYTPIGCLETRDA